MKKEHMVLGIILFFAFFLRLFRLPQMVGFDFDQEYAAMFAQTVLQDYPIQLIGQGLSVQGLFMGPLYFYYLVPFFAATSLHPLGGYVGSIVLGGVIVVTYYYVISHIFGKPAGFVAALLRAILFEKIRVDLVMAPAYSSELAIILTLLCCYKYWHGDYKYLIPLGFLFGLYTSFHPILFPFYVVFLLLLTIRRKLPHIKYILLSFVFLSFPLVPLLLFEYFHNFLEVRLLFSLDATSSVEAKTLKTLMSYISLLFYYPATVFTPTISGVLKQILSLVLLIVFAGAIIKKVGFWKDRFHIIFFIATIIVFLLYYYVLPTHATDYYFLGAEVIIFIYFVASLSLLAHAKKKLFFLGIPLLIVAILNFFALFNLWTNGYTNNLADKEAVIQEIAKRQKDNKMNIYYDIDYGQQYGFGYLARLYGLNPEGGDNVPTYKIVLPKSKTNEKLDFSSGNIGLLIEK